MEATIEQEFMPLAQGQGALVEIESARAIQEVQAAMTIAKRFPRDQNEAHTRIMKACERYSLADKATYAYPRGDKTVKGGSIRLAEVIAQNWGNLAFGIRELSQTFGRSEAEAFAWDMETNTRQTKIFQVPHIRYSKEKGNVKLTDPRDIYENVANLGARRMRACIFGVIPGDIVEDALAQCENTVREGNKKKPIKDRIRYMLKSFADIGINQEMIEKRLGHSVDVIIDDELIELNNIGRSILDGMTKRNEWFEFKSPVDEKLKKGSEKTEGQDIYKTKVDKSPKPKKKGEKAEEPPAGEQGESKEDQIEALYKNKTKLKFNKFLKSHLDYIITLDQKYQDDIRAEHKKHNPDDPYPLDKAPEKVEELPAEDEKEEPETPDPPITLNCPHSHEEVESNEEGRVNTDWCENNCPPEWRDTCVPFMKYQKNIGQ